MKTSATSRIKRAARRAKRLWSELDYAQRRVFEMRTGVPLTRPNISRSVDELERLYAA
ncbi:MAG TPA: hypothetical protein VIH85_02565 [Solirubrobacteraceae bacterium]